jgi:hypothetical protein
LSIGILSASLARDAPLEQQHEHRRPDEVAEEVRVPALLLGDAQDSVANVAVHVQDVGVGVVHVVVGVAPLVRRAGGVPLEVLGVQRRIVGPVVLAVHHVVADLHVVQDLGDRQRGGTAQPQRGQPAEFEHRASGDLETALGLDDLADVVEVGLAELGHHAVADRVEFLTEALGVFRGQVTVGDGHEMRPRFL